MGSAVCELEEGVAALADVDAGVGVADADADGGVGRLLSLAIYFFGLVLDGGDERRKRAGLSVLVCCGRKGGCVNTVL